MLVRLNCWRGVDGPGDVIDLDDSEAAALIHHGAAHAAPQTPDKPAATGKVVKGSAALEAATGTADGAT